MKYRSLNTETLDVKRCEMAMGYLQTGGRALRFFVSGLEKASAGFTGCISREILLGI